MFSIICYVVAGFFFYMVALLAFIRVPSSGMKAAAFSVPAVLLLVAGLVLSGFRRTLRDIGIVLVSSGGFTVSLVVTFACILASEESRNLMPPETRTAFSDYVTGFSFVGLLLASGSIALAAGCKKACLRNEPANRAGARRFC